MDGETIENNKTTIEGSDKISIKLHIAERVYSFKIKREDEEKIRKATKLIKEKVMYYRQRYENRDAQDALSMATLQFVLRMIELTENDNKQAINDELCDLNAEIENYLQIHEKK
ncbi:MAG: cell division protein ZapA [Prevotellaceae bacterium]|jgi:cell division protein ZapA|nr:cell division protein ZapA [Prevotellaceae bacterium]